MTDQEKSALRWGGLAGLLGNALLQGMFAFLSAFVGLDTVDAETVIEHFPEIR